MDVVFPCRTDAFFQASIKLAQPFPAPELRTEIYGHEDFSEFLKPLFAEPVVCTSGFPFFLCHPCGFRDAR